jgi:hypothetical protein
MTPDMLLPPQALVAAFQDLQLTVFEDRDGDRTRDLIRYFQAAEIQSQEMQIRSMDFEEKQFARQLSEAFAASGRILQKAWQQAHGHDLTV